MCGMLLGWTSLSRRCCWPLQRRCEQYVSGAGETVDLPRVEHGCMRRASCAAARVSLRAGGDPARGALQHGLLGRAVLEADGVTNLSAQLAADLLRHARGHGHGRHAPRLRAPDPPQLAVARLMQILRDLRATRPPPLSAQLPSSESRRRREAALQHHRAPGARVRHRSGVQCARRHAALQRCCDSLSITLPITLPLTYPGVPRQLQCKAARLRGLAGAGLADDDHDLVRLHGGQQLVAVREHGQQRTVGLQLLKVGLGGRRGGRALALLRCLRALVQVLRARGARRRWRDSGGTRLATCSRQGRPPT